MQSSSNKGRIDTGFCHILAYAILILLLTNYSPFLQARECKTQAELLTDFYLCESTHTGKRKLYSCRDYRQDNSLYRVYYKGGKTPKALATVDQKTNALKFNHLEKMDNQLADCDIAPPEGVPQNVNYLGSGVCENDQQQAVPCSVYRQATARHTAIYHYLVFYDNHADGSLLIDKQIMGNNLENAMTAELAYQIGLQLLESHCCQKNALEYLAHAHKLFPHAEEYRETYHYYKLETASLKQDFPCRNKNGKGFSKK